MSNILFSIVVPIYNQEKYLDECVKSVLEQDFSDYELILVNDGSTDSSGTMCDDYAKKDSRIKVVHKENGGLVSARKAGAAIASAEYIVTLDSDDYMTNNSLNYIADIIHTHSPNIVSTGFVSFCEDSSTTPFYPSLDSGLYQGEKLDQLKKLTLYNNRNSFFKFGLAPAIWSNVISRKLYLDLQKNVDDRIKMGEDVCVTFPAVLNCNSLYVTDFKLINYRILSTSISHRFRKNDLEDLKLVISHFSKVDLSAYNAANQFNSYVLYRTLCAITNCAQNTNNYKDFSQYMVDLDDTIIKCIKNIDKNTLPTKAKLLLFMISNRLWYFLRLYYIAQK